MIEKVTYSTYQRYKTTKSKLGLREDITTEDGINCPRCEAYCMDIAHGKMGTCRECGLYMKRYGNALYCSDEVEQLINVH